MSDYRIGSHRFGISPVDHLRNLAFDMSINDIPLLSSLSYRLTLVSFRYVAAKRLALSKDGLTEGAFEAIICFYRALLLRRMVLFADFRFLGLSFIMHHLSRKAYTGCLLFFPGRQLFAECSVLRGFKLRAISLAGAVFVIYLDFCFIDQHILSV